VVTQGGKSDSHSVKKNKFLLGLSRGQPHQEKPLVRGQNDLAGGRIVRGLGTPLEGQ